MSCISGAHAPVDFDGEVGSSTFSSDEKMDAAPRAPGAAGEIVTFCAFGFFCFDVSSFCCLMNVSMCLDTCGLLMGCAVDAEGRVASRSEVRASISQEEAKRSM